MIDLNGSQVSLPVVLSGFCKSSFVQLGLSTLINRGHRVT
uniref:Uncharacterized protein n=1 Tax=Arundo donax TaxID=35708 RepID=A0A0A9ETS1_ARUDO